MKRLLSNVLGLIVISVCWLKSVEGRSLGHIAISTVMDKPSSTSNKHVTIASFQTFQNRINVSVTRQLGFSLSYSHSIMSLDVNRKKLYIYDRYTAAIYVMSNFTADQVPGYLSWSQLHAGVSRGSVKLAVDWISNNLYWTDSMYRWIVVQSLDNYGKFKILFHSDLEYPLGIAVDPIHNYMFWSVAGSTPKIERSTLTGTNRKVIVSTGILHPTAIDVDVANSEIFWTDASRDTVEMASFTGSGRKTVRRLSGSYFYDIALFQDTIFVTTLYSNSKKRIIIMNKTTGELVNELHSFDVIAVSVVSQTTQPLITVNDDHKVNDNTCLWCVLVVQVSDPQICGCWMLDLCSSNPCSDICVNGPAGYDCLCQEGFLLRDGTCVENAGPLHRGLVWSTPTAICVADIRGINDQDRFIGAKKTWKYGAGTAISYVVVDSHDRKIIYTDHSTVKAMNVDDMSIIRTLFTTTETITGLAVDWRDGNVYWCQGKSHGAGQIWVFSQTVGTSYKLVHNLDNVISISIVPLQSIMLWITGGDHDWQIFKSKLDGTEIQVLVNNLTSPVDLTVDLDKNLVYFIDNDYIQTVLLDGTDNKFLSTHSILSSTASPSRIYTYKHYMFMVDMSYQRNERKVDLIDLLDVSIEGTLSALINVTDIAILDITTQAELYGPCDIANGDCEHLCIPIGTNRVCQCDYGFTLETNKKTCTSEPLLNNFILVVDWTHSNIYQVSLVSGEAQGLDSDMIQKPAGIEYNHLTGKVIWGDTGDYLLQQVNLDGTGYEVLVNVGMYNAHPDRIAIDYSTGNIFYTAVNTTVLGFSGVAVVTPNGIHKTIVRIMIWTDFGTTPAVLMQANMDRSDIAPVYDKLNWPNGIAISTKVKTVFITDGHESSNRIYSCTFNGSCSLFHEDPGAHLMDLKLLEHYLFYSAWNKAYITRIDIHSKEVVKFADNAELGRLDAIAVYMSSFCSPNNGRADCSTLCLPNSSGYTCACADGVSLLPDGKTCSDATSTTRSRTSVKGSPAATTKGTSLTLYIGVGTGIALVLIVALVIVCTICNVQKRERADDCTRYQNDTEGFDNSAVYQGDSVDIRGFGRHQFEPSQYGGVIRAAENQAYSARQNDDYLHFPQRDSMYDVIPADTTPHPPNEVNRVEPSNMLHRPLYNILQSTAEVSGLSYISDLPSARSMHTNSVLPSIAGDSYLGWVRSEESSQVPYISGRGHEETFRKTTITH